MTSAKIENTENFGFKRIVPKIALKNRESLCPRNSWGSGAFRGRPYNTVFHFQLSGFYFFGLPDSAFWTHLVFTAPYFTCRSGFFDRDFVIFPHFSLGQSNQFLEWQ